MKRWLGDFSYLGLLGVLDLEEYLGLLLFSFGVPIFVKIYNII